nr:hypothetical protein GCM10025730_40900 [Promicromonospora thailandica]
MSEALQDLQARIARTGPPSGTVGRDVAATSSLLDQLLRSTTVTKDKAVAEHRTATTQVEKLTRERDALRAELDALRSGRVYRLAKRYRRVRRAVLGRVPRR